jgi:subtilisin family serine protease
VDITIGSSNVIIGVIDTGIAYDHPDLATNMWKNQGEVPNDGIDNDGNGLVDDVFGYDFRDDDSEPIDPEGHGTHVAGTIGAVGNNNSGVTGVMQRVKLMALKAGGADGVLPLDAIVQAIDYAIKMALVQSMLVLPVAATAVSSNMTHSVRPIRPA